MMMMLCFFFLFCVNVVEGVSMIVSVGVVIERSVMVSMSSVVCVCGVGVRGCE